MYVLHSCSLRTSVFFSDATSSSPLYLEPLSSIKINVEQKEAASASQPASQPTPPRRTHAADSISCNHIPNMIHHQQAVHQARGAVLGPRWLPGEYAQDADLSSSDISPPRTKDTFLTAQMPSNPENIIAFHAESFRNFKISTYSPIHAARLYHSSPLGTRAPACILPSSEWLLTAQSNGH